MDTARYVVAVLIWIGLPPAVVYWFLIHPFAGQWRRIGKWTALAILTVVFLLEAAALYAVRPDESRVLGCVYVNKGIGGPDAAVRNWMKEAWPFERVVYPGRGK